MNEMHFVILAVLVTLTLMVLYAIKNLRENKDQRCNICLCRRSNHIWYFAGCKVHNYCEEFEHDEKLANI